MGQGNHALPAAHDGACQLAMCMGLVVHGSQNTRSLRQAVRAAISKNKSPRKVDLLPPSLRTGGSTPNSHPAIQGTVHGSVVVCHLAVMALRKRPLIRDVPGVLKHRILAPRHPGSVLAHAHPAA
eukprot:360136-Chlamydomonas_euryale.AAC.4